MEIEKSALAEASKNFDNIIEMLLTGRLNCERQKIMDRLLHYMSDSGNTINALTGVLAIIRDYELTGEEIRTLVKKLFDIMSEEAK